MDKKLTNPIVRHGFLQAFGVTLYCGFVGLFFWNANEIFGRVPNYFGPVAFVMLFSFSVLICALIVFYEPYKLFFDNKKKDAIDLVLFTTGWLFMFLLIILLFAFVFPKP